MSAASRLGALDEPAAVANARATVGHVLEQALDGDVLVNNAGVTTSSRTDALAVEDWHHVIDVSLTGAFLTTRACPPLLRAAGGAAVVNVSPRHRGLPR
jgi:NAD(P)-dependent dehydrogenase (short-subunit alcohol dehydrogenase family)